MIDRYHRQRLLPMIGEQGQALLAKARVVIVGCGALGTVAAELLARAGVGSLRLIDRDIVEVTNLQRQTLYDESDASEGRAKAVAAAGRLRAINSAISIEAVVSDVTPRNAESVCLDPRPTIVIDGTDNAETRYLLNDACVKHGVPWVYGGAVGTQGRVMPVRPGVGPCLRCVFPEPPEPGSLETCDTVGVLGPLTAMVAAMQATAVLRIIVGADPEDEALVTIDGWSLRSRAVSVRDGRRDDCECCGRRHFEFLGRMTESATRMCGRSSVQIDLGAHVRCTEELVQRLGKVGVIRRGEQLMHFEPYAEAGVRLTLFSDGRVIVHGVRDPQRARVMLSTYLGI